MNIQGVFSKGIGVKNLNLTLTIFAGIVVPKLLFVLSFDKKKNREDPKTGIANKSFEWEILISREYLTRFQVCPADYQ